ncbi:MAG: hypothetical protein LC650_02255 [Actinobacteria bacterium]|nr:hypothetical protein [Actinomycetota bacterium]
MEHYRPNGKLRQGYFCVNCGQSASMMGHKDCSPNPELVRRLVLANQPKPRFTLGYKEVDNTAE